MSLEKSSKKTTSSSSSKEEEEEGCASSSLFVVARKLLRFIYKNIFSLSLSSLTTTTTTTTTLFLSRALYCITPATTTRIKNFHIIESTREERSKKRRGLGVIPTTTLTTTREKRGREEKV